MAFSAGQSRAPKFLLIQPRWLDDESVRLELELRRRESPAAQFTILSASAARFDGAALIPLPPGGNRKQLLSTILKLRRTKFDDAIIVAEAHRTEHGYFESKVWAFISRARRRLLGRTKTLSLSEEFAPKLRLVLRAVVERALEKVFARFKTRRIRRKNRRDQAFFERLKQQGAVTPIRQCPVCQAEDIAATPDPYHQQCTHCKTLYRRYAITEAIPAELPAEQQDAQNPSGIERRARRLQAFVYQTRHDNIFGKIRGHYIDTNGDEQYYAVAGVKGWSFNNEKFNYENFNSGVAPRSDRIGEEAPQYDLITSIDDLNTAFHPTRFFADLKARLEHGGACLLRIATADKTIHNDALLGDLHYLHFPSRDAIVAMAQRNRLKVVEIQDSLFQAACIEVWLQNDDNENPH